MSGGIDGEHEPFTGEQDQAGEAESIEGADDANLETPPADQGEDPFRTPVVENREDMFVDAKADDDVPDGQFQELENGNGSKDESEKEWKEERDGFVREVAGLRKELRGFVDGGLVDDDDRSDESLREMVNECSNSVKVVLEQKLEDEKRMDELHKDIEELNVKEVDMVEKLAHLEERNRRLVEEVESAKAASSELERVKEELEREKDRSAKTKEKLSMAVTKGKALVQQRDSLKQSLAEKASELEKCLAELQDKTSAVEAAEHCKEELVKCENLVSSLQNSLSQRNAILAQTFISEDLQPTDLEGKLRWIVDLVGSLQESISQQTVVVDNINEILSQAAVPEELKSADITVRLRWLLDLAVSQKETITLRSTLLGDFEETLAQISLPDEVQSEDVIGKLQWLAEDRRKVSSDLLEFQKLKDALSLIDMPEDASSSDLVTQIGWLKGSVDQAKESARNDIDQLAASITVEIQEKEFLKAELNELMGKHEEMVEKERQALSDRDQIVNMLVEITGVEADGLEGSYPSYSDVSMLVRRCLDKIKEKYNASVAVSPADDEVYRSMESYLYVKDQELTLCKALLEEDELVRLHVHNLSDSLRTTSQELETLRSEKESMKNDLNRSEEKCALLREKLTLAVKKGKGLVQDRENLKSLVDEKKSEIEKLKLEVQQQESVVGECRDQINRLSTDLERAQNLEADLVAAKDQRDQFQQLLLQSNDTLHKVMESFDHITLPIASNLDEPVEKMKSFAYYLSECQQAKNHLEQEYDKVKEEYTVLTDKLAEAKQNLKSVEDALSGAENQISELADEKRALEIAKKNVELDLQKALHEVNSGTSKVTEANAARSSLEDALSLAENNIAVLVKEREDALISKAAVEADLENVREEVDVQSEKLTDAYRSMKSLEDTLSEAETKVASLTEENNGFQAGRTQLENELKKLKYEAESHVGKLEDTSSTIKAMEDALSKAMNDNAALQDEKRIAEQEISTLNSKLNACMDQLAGTSGSLANKSVELISHLTDLQMLTKSDELLSAIRQHFEKQYQNLNSMDLILNDCFANGDLQMLQVSPVMDDSYARKAFPHDTGSTLSAEMESGDDVGSADLDNVSLYFKKFSDGLQLRSKILTENFEGLSSFTDEFAEALLSKLRKTKDAIILAFERMELMKQKMMDMETSKEEQDRAFALLEKEHKVVLSACINATSELQFESVNGLMDLKSVPELEKLNQLFPLDNSDIENRATDEDSEDVKMVEKLLSATRKVRNQVRLFERTSEVAAAVIEDLQNKMEVSAETSENILRERDLLQSKAVELQNTCQQLRTKLEDHESILKERDLLQSRVAELEADIEASQNSCLQLRAKLEDYNDSEKKLHQKEVELSTLQSNLLTKEQGSELGSHGSSDVDKLFYIVDSVLQLQNQINALASEKDQLQSTLSKQILEIELLKDDVQSHSRNQQYVEMMKGEISEIAAGLEKIIDVFGGDEVVADRKPGSASRLLPLLEKQVKALFSDSENAKSHAQELGNRLLESQKVVDELSTRVKVLEDSDRSRNSAQPEIFQERSVFEAPSQPSGSEISEAEDADSIGKNPLPPVPKAALVRTTRKGGSSDHLAISIDSESAALINNDETDEDKGHAFKSLNTSGLIPRHGKSLADRVDGICYFSSTTALRRRSFHQSSGISKLCRFRTNASGKRKTLKKKQRIDEGEQSEPVLANGSDSELQKVSYGEIAVPSKGAVIQACTLTSGFIAGFGILLRQVSHVAAEEGLPILDCSEQVSFGFQIWHLGLILGLVVLISSSRYLLLKTWPDFAESSEAANRQVLSSLEPLDYLLVAFLPGVSEELLFRGALQPLFGMDWKSVLVVAAIFGVLHLGNGRKYSFAVWATFVGCIYGYSAIASSSIIVPMASHALNNLVGGLLWRNSQLSNLSK
ncbi:Trans-Golgi network-localized SYP41-interacting protein 1 [Linum grandiflorum]